VYVVALAVTQLYLEICAHVAKDFFSTMEMLLRQSHTAPLGGKDQVRVKLEEDVTT
jgi:hypothetical protein